MRLPLIALFFAHSAFAETRAATWVSVHASTDNLVVVSPQASARVTVRDFELQGGWDADVITGASVDVRTSASPRGYTEVRQGITLGTTWRPEAGRSLAVHYTPSWENDYESETFSVTQSEEWLGHRLTTYVGARGSFDRAGRTGSDRATWRTLDTGGLELGLGWVFGPRTVGNLAFEGQVSHGFMASPYRFARVGGYGVPEQVPESRARGALAVSLRHALTPAWFATFGARLYDDSWAIASHTEEVELAHTMVHGKLTLSATARLYGQSAASFYQPSYSFVGAGIPLWRTADKLLAPSLSGLGAARASWAWRSLGPLDELRATAKLELYGQRLYDFLPLAARGAAVFSFGLAGEL